MVEYVIAQAIPGDGIVDIVGLIGHPVVAEFFGAKDQNPQVAVFVVFDDGQGGEGFAKTDTVRQDTAVILFQLADNGDHGVFLEGVQFVPDLAFLEAVGLAGQIVFIDLFQKAAENIVKREKVEKFGAVLLVGGGDALQNFVCDVFQVALVIPQLVEQFQVSFTFWCIHAVDHAEHTAATVTAQVLAGKAIHWCIRHRRIRIYSQKACHSLHGLIGLEAGFFPDPLRTFLRDCALAEFAAELNLELTAMQCALAVQPRNIKFPLGLLGLLVQKCGRCEYKVQLVQVFKLCFQLFKCVDRKTGRGYGNTTVLLHRYAQIISQLLGNVVDDFHGHPSFPKSVPFRYYR